jgi:hypothetical protein
MMHCNKRNQLRPSQWALNRDRLVMQPATALFPNGVPFKAIRKFQAMMPPKPGANRVKKLYPHSIKRGR